MPRNPIRLILLLLILGPLAGPVPSFAAPAPSVHPDDLAIVTEASDHATFFGYWTLATDKGLKIRGDLRKRLRYPSILGGHILVQLLDAEGRVIRAFDAPHRRFPQKQRQVRFEIEVTDLTPGTHTIRLIHQG